MLLHRHNLVLLSDSELELYIGHLPEADRHFLLRTLESLGDYCDGVDAGPQQREMEFARGGCGRSMRLARGVAQYCHLAGGHNRTAWIGHRTDKLTRNRGLSEAVKASSQGQYNQPQKPQVLVSHS